ncbi:Uncharacterised protein [Kluyvera cryocrescens]|uniref:Uncharacterized protein n=1 Tax=Kluyvera cryocrescens TaxID=580 RepID=A0A485ACC1_KLUCR|nr:Uncharacterised protein [Kluyvera cryocrescens]
MRDKLTHPTKVLLGVFGGDTLNGDIQYVANHFCKGTHGNTFFRHRVITAIVDIALQGA